MGRGLPRLRRDRLALAGGFFIVLLPRGLAGALIAAALGHGPNEPFLVTGGLDAEQLPAGPWTTVGKLTEDGTIEEQLFVLGSDSTLARDEFLRILYGAQVSSRSASARRCCRCSSARCSGRSPGSSAGGRTRYLADGRPHDGLPVPALRDHSPGRSGPA